MRLKEKIAVITGSAQGIGRAIAMRFSAEGAHVVVNDINKEGALSVSQAIIDAGGSAMAISADVSNRAQVKEMFDRTLERFSALNILVNNAAIVSPMLHFLDKDADESWWQKIINVNRVSTGKPVDI